MNRTRHDDDLRTEIDEHIRMRAEWHEQRGAAADEARRAAVQAFGNPTLVQEEMRRVHISAFVESVMQDVCYAFRTFLRQPLFTFTALVAIALGIGACTAVFSIVDRILFRPLPYRGEAGLVSFGVTAPIEQQEFMLSPDYFAWRSQRLPFESVTSFSPVSDCDLSEENPVRLRCAPVEPNFLDVLGVKPLIGRSFEPGEDQPGVPKVAILSHALWRSRFGGVPDIAGRSFSLDGQRATVIGVLPPDFEHPASLLADLLVPQAFDQAARGRPGIVLRAIGRLRPNVDIPQAEAALLPLFRQSLEFVPAAFRGEVRLRLRSVRDRRLQDSVRASWVASAAVLMVLLISCANVANLLLARSASRQGELAIRAAVGGGRLRLIRQSLTESLLLSVAGATAGGALAWVLLRVIASAAPQGILGLPQAHIDFRVLLFTVAVSLLSGLLFGVAPALQQAPSVNVAGGQRVTAPRNRLRHALIAAQLAAALVLVTASGLLLQSFKELQRVPLGIEPAHVVTAAVTLPRRTPPPQAHAFFEELEHSVSRLPGVTAISDSLPPAGNMRAMIYSRIEVEGRERPREGTGGMVAWRIVTPGYFSTLGIPVRAGRGFVETDRDADAHVIVLGRQLSRRLFGTESPVGKRVRMGGPWHTVIGIVGDVSNNGLRGPHDPEYYVVRKHAFDPAGGNQFARSGYALIRTGLPTATAAQWLRSAIAELAPALPVTVEPMAERIDTLADRPRFNALLMTMFAAVGVVLAAIGLYGVVSFVVTQRTTEIGVRMAIGATPGAIAKLVLGHASVWGATGIGAGVLGAVLATRALESLLYNVRPADPRTLGGAAALLLAVTLVAAWVPSRRAARVDPARSLRQP